MERSQEAADAAKTAMRQILDEYNSTMDSIKADLQDKNQFLQINSMVGMISPQSR